MIENRKEEHEGIGLHLDIVGVQPHAPLACFQLQVEQTAFFAVPPCGYRGWLARISWGLLCL